MDLQARTAEQYEFLDAGDGARLERFGDHLLHRPAPAALWPRERPDLWPSAAGVYHRASSGGGHWTFPRALPESWPVAWDDLVFRVKPTGFGHVGLFPEHTCHWDWVRREAARCRETGRVLNLFAYTGGLTLVAARAGAEVCHVDAVRDVNAWARGNAASSGLGGAAIRWITDDAMKFVAREVRRGRRYDGLVLDPPSYGKGPRAEKWIIEEHLPRLLAMLPAAMSPRPQFLLFTCHTLGFSPPLMQNLLLPWQARFGGGLEAGTMLLANARCRCVLPCGFFARWTATPSDN